MPKPVFMLLADKLWNPTSVVFRVISLFLPSCVYAASSPAICTTALFLMVPPFAQVKVELCEGLDTGASGQCVSWVMLLPELPESTKDHKA